MKAEFEPWWMFEDWEETIVSRYSFKEVLEVKAHLKDTLAKLRKTYENEAVKKDCFYAFWSEEEKKFCEACDEDLQIYHGVIIMKEGKPTSLVTYKQVEDLSFPGVAIFTSYKSDRHIDTFCKM